MSFIEALKLVTEDRAKLRREEACVLMGQILGDQNNEIPDIQIASLLAALAVRGVTPEELAGFVDAMRAASVTLPLTETERAELVDTCGTGGDASGTINISTGAALLAAATGAKIAKHGNRSVTSRCGSADVLEALGVPVNLSPERSADCLRQTGFVFLYAPAMHPAMRRVQPLRRALGYRTVFNILGPLTNPAGARRQVMGVYASELVPLVAEAMQVLNITHGLVVHGLVMNGLVGNRGNGANGIDGKGGGLIGLDELSLCGPSRVAEVRQGQVVQSTLTVEETGLQLATLPQLAGGDAEENARLLQEIFDGRKGRRRDILLLNAAAALRVSGKATTLREGIALATAALDAGAAKRTLKLLVEFGD